MRAVSPLSLISAVATLVTLLFVLAPISQTTASPIQLVERSTSSSYWLANIKRQGSVAFGDSSSYTVYRNVKDYGAKGDGSTDDTAAINAAITDGNRCGWGCDSSTTTPALVYFPPGTYMVSTPIIMLYYTQLIGDALTLPTLKATSGFQGMAVIDSDPYDSSGAKFTNQNNFFRQVRNFVIDLTGMPQTAGAGIHWQVAQATSLQNIVFNMISGSASKQIGVFMDNGSGNFMGDLVFNGGNYGAFLGNQQFTSRNWTFNNCNTAIFMNWNWAWTMKSVTVNNCGVGLDMSNGGSTDGQVGSVILIDSKMTNTPIGVKTSFTSDSSPTTAGTLIIDNVDFTGTTAAVTSSSGSTILAGGSVISSWGQGRQYAGKTGSRVQGALSAPSKPASLLSSSGAFFERSKPQYESYPASSFISVKSFGAVGDGVTDDTAAIQKAMNGVTSSQILYFDHGAYIVTKTIQVPATIKMTGEIWPLIMASGSFFANQKSPQPVFNVGTAGQSGGVEISDLIFETKGAAPGAIMIKWNLASTAGASGMWDAHVRIGGSAGTELQSDTCAKDPTSTAVNTACEGAYLLFWATSKSSGVYLENTWFWVADHELDLADHNQINIYNGRGVLIESQGPVWLYGTSSEHSIFYNYQLNGAKDVFMGMIQSETPYFQSNPKAPTPLSIVSSSDPNWGVCSTQSGTAPCYKSWGLRVLGSTNVFIYGTGLYSFFENYSQDCLTTNSCQRNMIGIQGSISNLNMYSVTTKASVNMVTLDGEPAGLDADNRNVFGATMAYWTKSGSTTRDCEDEDDEYEYEDE